jgi:hypothetical protein
MRKHYIKYFSWKRKAKRNLGDLDVFANMGLIHPTDDMLHGLTCEDGN